MRRDDPAFSRPALDLLLARQRLPGSGAGASPQPLRLALEPRLLFDGAAIATAVAQLFAQPEAAVPDSTHAAAAGHAPGATAEADASQTAMHAALADAPDLHPGASAAADAPPSPPAADRIVVFIDQTLAHREVLLAAVPAGAQVVLLDPQADGLQQINDALAGRTDITALHLISHGNSGVLQLGSTVLDTPTLQRDGSGLLAAIGQHLAQGADVLVYGCDFGAGLEGAAASQALAHALGADVAASDDATGAAARGGDWDLERHVGAIQAQAFHAEQWDGLLLPPVAVADVALVQANGSVVINVLANDIDLEGNALTVRTASALHGSVAINGNGTLTYTPTTGYFGVDVITYTIRDSTLLNALLPGTVAVVVNAPPTLTLPGLPVFTEDTPLIFASLLGTQISVGDVDGSIALVTLSVPVGTLTLAQTTGLTLSQGSGTSDTTITFQGSVAQVNAALNGLVYTPAADYNGPVHITVGLTDTLLALPISINLPLTIAAVADIVADNVATGAGQSVTFNVLANDTFENSGRVVSGYTTPAHGTVTVNAQGQASYTPASGYAGTDTFSYTVSSNGTTETATVTVTVTVAPNTAPTATALTNLAAHDAQAVGVNVASAFGDADGDTLSYSASGLPAGLTINASTGVISGTLGGHASTAVAGGAYTVVVTASDGRGGSADQSFVLSVANPAPTAAADSATLAEDGSRSGNVLTNDSDSDGDTFTVSTTPVSGPAHGSLVLSSDGSYLYTPTANYNGADSFTYRITDADGGTATAVVSLTITAVNDAPTASAAPDRSSTVGASLSVAVAAYFADVDGDALVYTATGLPLGLTINAGTGVISGTPLVAGPYAVTISATDGSGASASNSFNWAAVAQANNAPTTSGTLTSVGYSDGATLAISTALAFSDPDGDVLTYSAANLPAGLSIGALTGVISGTVASHASAAVAGGVYNVVVTASDSRGGTVSNGFTFTASNVAPVAFADSAVGIEDNPISGNVRSNDIDADGDTLTVDTTPVAAPAHGSVVLQANGNYVYTPNANYAGSDSFTYRVTDGDGGSATATVFISVAAVNDLPTISLPNVTLFAEDQPIIFASAFGNQISVGDVDGNVARITLSVPVGGLTLAQTTGLTLSQGTGSNDSTVTIEGSIAQVNAALNGLVYTPGADYNGLVTVTVGLTDTLLALPISTTLPITIAAVADIVADHVNTLAGQNVTFNVLDNDSFENSGRVVSDHTAPLHGSVSINAQGQATYTPGTGYVGSDTFSYTVTSNGTQETAKVTVTVAAANQVPLGGTLGNLSANDAQAVSLNVAGAFSDPDGDPLSFSASGLPAGLSIHASTGVISGQIQGHASTAVAGGAYTVLVSADDGRGGTVSQSFVLTVHNPAPTAVADSATLAEDGSAGGNLLANDSDTDGDALTLGTTPVVGPAHGTLVLNANGSYVYTPQANYNGTDSFTYRVIDADGGSATAVVSLTITAVNDAPTSTALPDRSSTLGTSVTVNASAHYTDVDGDALLYTALGLPPGLTLNASTGVVSGTPLVAGSYTVTLSATDTGGLSTSQSFNWVATAQADHAPAPVGSLAAGSGNDGAAVAIGTAAGFSDADNDVLAYSATGLPAGLSINATSGVISGTLAANASSAASGGVYTVVVTANDGRGGSATQGFTFTASNPGPTALADIAAVTEDGSVSGNVLTNDTDIDGDALTVSSTPVVAPAHGTLALSTNGSYTYTPDANFAGIDSFSYRVTDADGASATATVSITVVPVNDAPTSTTLPDRSNTVGASVSVNASANYTDVDGDALVYTATGLPPGLTVNPTTGVISGTLATVGNYTVTLSATDAGGLSTSQSFDWVAAAQPNNAPNAVGSLSAGSGNDGAAVTIGTAAGFSDADHNPLAFGATGLPAGLSINATTGVISGTLAANASSAASGGVYTVVVTASDGHGGSATQGFTFTASNPGPTALADIAAVAEDGSVSGNVLTNDSDIDGDALTISTTPVTAPTHGTLALSSNGSYTYTPDANFAGTDSFTYRVTDADGASATATVSITVTAVNDAPTSTALPDRSNTIGASVSINESAHYADVDGDALSYTATGLPPGLALNATTGVISGTLATVGSYTVTLTATDAGGLSTSQSFNWVAAAQPNNAPNSVGSLSAGSGNDGAAVTISTTAGFNDADHNPLAFGATGLPAGLSINATTGVISGTLAANASSAAPGGVYTVVVTASDGHGGSATQGFTFTASNPGPTATADIASVAEDGSVSGNVLTNDSDIDGDALTISTTPVTAPTHGTLALSSNGSYTYTPDANFAGTDSFTYRVTDADGASATATVSITVTAVNDAPTSTALPDRSNTIGASVNINESAHYTDVDGDALIYTATGLPPGLTLNATTGVISGTLATAGSYTVTLTATDASGLSTSQSFNWLASTTANNGPNNIGTLAAGSANDGAPVTIGTAASFSDADNDLLGFSATGLPPGLSINATTGVISGTLAANASSAASGGVYTVVITATDGHGGSATQGFTFTASNPGPTATADTASVAEDGSVSGNVLANDTDIDGDALTISTTPVTAPAHGTLVLSANGSYTYTPDANFAGTDSFTYQLIDADGGTSTASVSISVAAVNDAPTSTTLPDRSNTLGASVTVNVSANYTDVDGEPLAYTATGLPPGLTLNATTGVISGTLATAGSYTVTLSATDAGGLSTSQSFTWLAAAPINNGPNTVGTLATGSGNDGTAVAINAAAGFSDVDNDALAYSATGLPPGLSINATTGAISGTLAANASSAAAGGVYTVVVTASDGLGGSATQGFTFTASNTGPIATADNAAVAEDGSVSGNVLTNDSDIDGDALTISTTPVVAPAHGTLVLSANGSYTYTPDANFAGTDSFTYQLIDADGGTSTASVSISVAAVNDAPTSTALPDRSNTVGASVSINASANYTDVDGDALVYTATGLPPGLTLNPGTGVIGGALATAGSYTVTLTATDAGGLSTSQSFTWVAAAPVNNGPDNVGTLATGSASDGAPVAIDTAASFHDTDNDPLGFSATGLPPGLSINASTGLISGTLAANASSAASGGVYTVVVTATDGRGGSATQGFTFTASNTGPTATADTASVAEDGSVSGNVLTNDTDADGDALTISTTPVVAPAHGTLVLNTDGSYTYTPDANFAGTDSFTYQLVDADGGTSTASVSISVAAVNDAPTSTALADRSTFVGAAVNIDASANYADVDGEPLVYTATGLPPGLTLNATTGVISGTLASAGSYTVTLTATDAGGLSTSQSFNWLAAAAPANNGPTIVGTLASGTANDGTVVTIGTAASFHDADNDPLSFSATGLPPGLTINASTGVISGTLAANASSAAAGGVYTAIVTADDGKGGVASLGFTLTVHNPAPQVPDQSVVVSTTGSVSGNLLAGAVDPDGDALTVDTAPVQAPAHGTLVIRTDGSYLYVPNGGFTGTDTFIFKVVDSAGASTVASVSLTVATPTPTPDPTLPPVVTPDPIQGFTGAMVAASTTDDSAPETLLDSGLAEPDRPTDNVLLDAINRVKRLDGQSDLSGRSPVTITVNAVSELSGRAELGGNAPLVSAVVGDLSARYRTHLRVGDIGSADSGAVGANGQEIGQAVPGSLGSTDGTSGTPSANALFDRPTNPNEVQGLTPDELPGTPTDTSGIDPLAKEAREVQRISERLAAFSPGAERPITLTEQLRAASLRSHREIDLLAGALS